MIHYPLISISHDCTDRDGTDRRLADSGRCQHGPGVAIDRTIAKTALLLHGKFQL